MKILQIYELNPIESIGGVETAVFQLSKELVKRGHEITILTGACDKKGCNYRDGVRIISTDLLGTMKYTYRSGRLTPLRQVLFLCSILARKTELEYDIYHGHIYTSGLIANYLAGKHNGIAVNTIHGSYYPVWDKLTNPISALFYRAAEKQLATLLAKRSHLQIHVSTYFAQQVSAWGGRVKMIPNGVDTSVFHPEVTGCLHGSLPVILTARRLVRKNGIEYLIKAMEFLKDLCELIIIGDGPERHRLELLAKNMKNIKFLGAVPHPDMPSYIAGADIAVVPSIIEASSLFMLEAMAMGKPVVASCAGGLPETLGGSGILVPPMHPELLAKAILELLNDPQMRMRLGIKARRRVEEEYTWQKIAMQTEREYLHLRSEKHA
ncbi:MAG: glycosyltransferase family 4 protein [Candidatus Methanoperedens sp.]|nr:glycosyltransferase family 4 protein [Candidatus Methanoperedens sp.]MCZ7406588.1 glycosyltransferase family 4 protein [Candidatus Methanoperedens sp.]